MLPRRLDGSGSKRWRGRFAPQAQQDRWYTFIDEAGFYELIFSSKLEAAKKFRDWVFTIVLPSIRKYGQYKLFDSPWNKMIMIGNETDLHYKVVDLIRRYYLDSILVAGLGENQDTEDTRWYSIITKIIKASVLNSNHQLTMCQKPNWR